MIAEKLKRLRGDRPRLRLAEQVGCSESWLRSLESGSRLDAPTGLKLARAFHVSLEWLADDDAGWPPAPLRREDIILDAVREALRPFTSAEGFFGEELDVLRRLAAVHPTCRGNLFLALGAMIDVFLEGESLGREAEASKVAEPTGLTPDERSARAARRAVEDTAGAQLDAAVPPRRRSGGAPARRKGADGA